MHIAGSLEEQGRRTWGNILKISNFEASNVRSYDVDDKTKNRPCPHFVTRPGRDLQQNQTS